MQEHLSFIIGITITYLVLAQVPSILYDFYDGAASEAESFDFDIKVFAQSLLASDQEKSTSQIIIEVLLQILKWVLDIGFIYVFLRIIDGEETQVSDLFTQWGKVFSYVVASILYSLTIVVGLLLLIVPGIYFAIRLQFYAYLILDKNLNPFEALSESYNLTSNFTLDLFLLAIVFFLLFIAGFLALIIGLIPVTAFIAVVNAIVYRSLIDSERMVPARKFL